MELQFKSLKEMYTEKICEDIGILADDLTEDEQKIIDFSFMLFQTKLEDIKILEDDNKHIIL